MENRLAGGARRATLAAHRRLPQPLRELSTAIWRTWRPLDPTAGHREFLESAYQRLLGRNVDEVGLRGHMARLAQGATHAQVVMDIAESPEYNARVIDGLMTRLPGHDPTQDLAAHHRAFLEMAYQRLLGRGVDEVGLRSSMWRLANGVTPTEILLEVAESPEYAMRIIEGQEVAIPGREGMGDLTALWAGAYQVSTDLANRRMLTFGVRRPEDFDWLERQIVDNGYYERPGVWVLDIDLDKEVMAEVISLLGPSTVLELGCSSGAVLTCLDRLGIRAEGIEISQSSRALASPRIQERIFVGDLLDEIHLDDHYDVVVGLDIFEHLNPNRLDAYLAALVDHLADGGFLFANIPAFGDDAVFGLVNKVMLEEWGRADDGLFSRLPVDDLGYPLHGHLIWATTQWWCARFEAHGLQRQPAVERSLHHIYDPYLQTTSRARQSFYVFSKNGDLPAVKQLAEAIVRRPSRVLSECSQPDALAWAAPCQAPGPETMTPETMTGDQK